MRNINIEIKAPLDNHDAIRKTLKANNAQYVGIDFETDTFFNVRNGSLKLREGNVDSKLVYEDVEIEDNKDVLLYKTQNNSNLKKILEKSYGIAEIIEKHREVYNIENVSFYIDYVSTKGHFLSVKAIGRNNSHTKEELLEQIYHYIKLLKLENWEFIQNSYTDMLDQLSNNDSLNAA